MNRSYHILTFAFLLFLAADVAAQEQGVVVHTDPRLSILVKKKSIVMQASAARQAHHAAGDARIGANHSHLIAEAAHQGSGPAHPVPEAAHTPGAAHPPVAEVIHTPVGSAHPATGVVSPAPNPRYRAEPPPFVREREGRVIYSGKGFRVQIYNGPDRGKAIAIKTEFMRHNPGVRTYLTYVSPGFRVKVGDYRHRSDALGMLREANSSYSPCVIVPDIITINSY